MRAVLASLVCLMSLSGPVLADAPRGAALSPVDALACIAARYRGEALRIDFDDDDDPIEVRWLTPAGNVLEIEITGPGCRFIEVDGVGQTEALIPRTAR